MSRQSVSFQGALRERLEEARRAWPGVSLSPQAFYRHVAACLSEGQDEDALAALRELHCSDLYLACACARGDPRALAYFEDQLMPQVRMHVARIDPRPAFTDEVKQLVRDRLLVAEPGATPRIASYGGRGPLGGWLRITAIRVAQNLTRGAGDAAGERRSRIEHLPAAAPSPETDYLKRSTARVLRDAVEAVLRSLPAEERTMLRLHLCDGLGVQAIGKLYRVHASTIARRIARARDTVVRETRARLRQKLTLDERELDSLLAHVQSRVDLTLSRVLETH